jgi:hypothetical protein
VATVIGTVANTGARRRLKVSILRTAVTSLESSAHASRRLLIVLLVCAMAACASGDPPPTERESISDKVQLDLSGLNEDGLHGPPSGLRALAYEFCIPARQDLADDVRAIDPTIQVYPTGRGRIGCTVAQYLCIGSTHQPGFRTVLNRLAQLDYVMRIVPSYAE